MRARLTLILLAPALAGCQHTEPAKVDPSAFGKRVECAKLSALGKWETLPNGPFLDNTYYSPSLDPCVFTLKRSIRAERDGSLQHEYILVDALSCKQLWGNDPATGENEDQISTRLDDELKKLQIMP